MIEGGIISLACAADAPDIAGLSRDCIENGLSWRWRTPRVLAKIRDSATNVVVFRDAQALAGFAMMRYGEQEAHLLLLAVHPNRRRRGIGRSMLGWLEKSARIAGIGVIRLETRWGNAGARAFYRELGYQEFTRVRALYDGVEDGLRLAKDLWAES